MSTFALKITALILMFLDHTGLYFEGAPVWFRWLGRASYPLFLFSMVWGYHYTRNRKKYLLRLYLMSIFMTGFMYFIKIRFNAVVDYGYHNIFLSMLLVGVLISTIELFIKDRKKGGILIGVIVLVQILYYMLPRFFPFLRSLSGDTLTAVIPNLAMNEYGPEFVALGVLMYFLKEQKDVFTAVYLIFCICQFSEEMLAAGTATQWLMVLALPFMLSYNNQKGPGLKYFFYVFYPAHTFLLFYAAKYIFSK